MSPSPAPGPGPGFWRQVGQSVAAWLAIGAIGGVAYLTYQVPRMLDQLLAGQRQITERATVIEARVGEAEDDIQRIDHRVTRLEAR